MAARRTEETASGQHIQARHDMIIPWGAFAVRVAVSLILGVVMGAGASGRLNLMIVTVLGPGFCGARTTYSTFGYGMYRLAEDGPRLLAAANVNSQPPCGSRRSLIGVAIAASL